LNKPSPIADTATLTGWLGSVAELSSVRQDESMKIRSWLTRIGAHLLGVVDEYWAMREPAQYHQHLPCCDLKSEMDETRSTSQR
jgi:hypothetical protein